MRFTQGSDNICNSTPQQLAAEQAAMYVELGLLPGGSGEKCGGPVFYPNPSNPVAYWNCTVCTPEGCHHTIKPAPINPIANADPNCSSASQSGCTAPSAGAMTDPASGSTAAGGTSATGNATASSVTTDDKTGEQAPPAAPKDDSAQKPPNKGDTQYAGGDDPKPTQTVENQPETKGDPILLVTGASSSTTSTSHFPGRCALSNSVAATTAAAGGAASWGATGATTGMCGWFLSMTAIARSG